MFGYRPGRLSGESGELNLARPFVLAGVEWAGPQDVRIELRARAPGGRWTRWGVASTLGHGPDGPRRSTRLIGDPVWTGPAQIIQLRSSLPVPDVRLHLVDLSLPAAGAAAAARAGALPLAQPVLDAGPGQPPIIARSAWAGAHAPPAVAPGYGAVKLAFVHHTDSLNRYSAAEVPAVLLAMYQFHRFARGWNDLGYNFVIDLYGRIWEGRAGGVDQAVVGAQAGGYNTESTGVAVLGTFASAVPSRAALAALERLLAWKLSLHGLPASGRVTVEVDPAAYFYTPFPPGARVSLPRVAGHREGCTTDCPGNAFYARLPAVRGQVAALAGPQTQVTMRAPARASVAGAPVTVAGRLTAAGQPVAGAPIEVQSVSAAVRGHQETTLAVATTAADGTWSAQLAPTVNTLVRALHRPSPATASPLVEVAVAPVITLSPVSSAPLRVRGTIIPAERRLTVTLSTPGGRVLARRKVTARGGRFTAGFGARRPGSYLVTAHTAPNRANAGGASPPLAVTVG
jgi:N-acetylmuramoyl-L-alanine amidase-like protein